MADPQKTLIRLFERAVAAAQPGAVVPSALPEPPLGRTFVVGAGKAAAAMAAAVEDAWPGPLHGLVVVRDGYKVPCRYVEVVEAAHPVPDQRSEQAARRILHLVHQAGPDDLVLALWSGGASSLLAAPVDGITLADKQAITTALLAVGAPIQDINVVRKHLSSVKGGRIAVATQARVEALIISDVVGDDPSVIGSGPTAADPTTVSDALAVLDRYAIAVPANLRAGLAGGRWETPKTLSASVCNRIVARPDDALKAAHILAEDDGLLVINDGDAIEGEARLLGKHMAVRAMNLAEQSEQPIVLLSGGEATVTVDGPGKGGPNLEFALSFALAANGHPRLWALSCDTDGTDGLSSAAGAVVGPDTLAAIRAAGRDPTADLMAHDSDAALRSADVLVEPGPTRTNVNDFRAVLIGPCA